MTALDVLDATRGQLFVVARTLRWLRPQDEPARMMDALAALGAERPAAETDALAAWAGRLRTEALAVGRFVAAWRRVHPTIHHAVAALASLPATGAATLAYARALAEGVRDVADAVRATHPDARGALDAAIALNDVLREVAA